MVACSRLWTFVVAIVFAALAFVAEAKAEPCPSVLSMSPEQLASGISIPTGKAVVVPVEGIAATVSILAAGAAAAEEKSCALVLADGKLSPKAAGSCDALFGVENWGQAVTLKLPGAACGGSPVDVAVNRVAVTDVQGRYSLVSEEIRLKLDAVVVGTLYVPSADSGLWAQLTSEDMPSRNVFPASSLVTGKEVIVLARASDATFRRLTLTRNDAPHTCPSRPLAKWCKLPEDSCRSALLCFDATSGTLAPVVVPDGAMLRPNYSTTVVVQHCHGDKVTFSQDGTPGISVGGIDNARTKEVEQVAEAAHQTISSAAPSSREMEQQAKELQKSTEELKKLNEKTAHKPVTPDEFEALDKAAKKASAAAEAAVNPSTKSEFAESADAFRSAVENESAAENAQAPNDAERSLQNAAKAAAAASTEAKKAKLEEEPEYFMKTAENLKNTAAAARPKPPKTGKATQSPRQLKLDQAAESADKAAKSMRDARLAATKAFEQAKSDYQLRLSKIEAKLTAVETEPQFAETVHYVFGPRKPGAANFHVTVGDNDEPVVQELTVVPKTIAAVRMGAGLVFGTNAVPPTYGAMTPSGSKTAIITETDKGGAAAELVVGFAPYVFDYIAWGGRSYENHDTAYVAPYFGVGVVSAQTTGVSAFTSFYGGLEFEFVRHISLAAAGVLRRTTELTGGAQPGSAILGDVPTRQGWGLGFGFVVNASPDIFEFSASSGGTPTEKK